MATAHDPNSIDSHVHDGRYNVRYQSPVWEVLVDMRWNPQKRTIEFHPMLATSWDISPDGVTSTCKLRKSVKCDDGHPVTAEAVKVTFERNRELRLCAAASRKSPCIESRGGDRDIFEGGGVRTWATCRGSVS